MNVTKTQLIPKTPPLPIAGLSINPQWVLQKLQKFLNHLALGTHARTLAARGKICFESLIWDGHSDISSYHEWTAFKYWVGVFMEGFDPVHLMALEPCYVPGLPTYIGTKYLEWIEEWIGYSIHVLKRFTLEYPGEQIRRVDLKEKAALGKAFEFNTLRVNGATIFTTDACNNVHEENNDEDWVDVGYEENGSNKMNEAGMDIQKQWVIITKGHIIQRPASP